MGLTETWRNKPLVTDLLIAINVVVFIAMVLAGGPTKPQVLVTFGAKINQLISVGQWWRLVTPMFLHLGVQHIVLNMVTLYFLGVATEPLFGHWRFLLIYLGSGVAGNVASYFFTPAVSAGASTAIFGLFGAYLMLGVAFREQPGIRQTARTFLTLVLLNVVFDMFGSGIDLAGHLGGLIGGFLLAYVLAAPRVGRVSWWQRGLAAVALVGLVLIAGYGLMMKAV